jgi:hypothetical protein
MVDLTNQESANPYASPTADASVNAEPPRKLFRWRLIPVMFLWLYGGTAVIGCIESIVLAIFSMSGRIHGALRADLPNASQMLALSVVYGVGGTLLILTAVSVWKLRWRNAGYFFVATIALAILVAIVMAIHPRSWSVGN